MAASNPSKRLKTTGPLIGTHNGHFHADEALAVYLLRLLPTYTLSPLLRTRDPTLLSTCHTVVDVGGLYDPSTNRYDHHQRTFTTTFPRHSTKLSSAGLIYMHFGKPIIAGRTGLDEGSPEVSLLYEKLYTDFIEAIDANDNGIPVYDPPTSSHLQKRFNDSGVTLSSLVSDLNHPYDPSLDTPSPQTAIDTSKPAPKNPADLQAEEDARFLTASSLMGTTFLRKLNHYATSWLPARSIVQSAYEARFANHPSGSVMVLAEGGVPWKDHLYTFESSSSPSSSPHSKQVLYVLYPESTLEGSKWRIQCVPISKDSFESRKPLPEKWRGVRDEELEAVSGVEGAVFVHASGFIGGAWTREGVGEMARKALEG